MIKITIVLDNIYCDCCGPNEFTKHYIVQISFKELKTLRLCPRCKEHLQNKLVDGQEDNVIDFSNSYTKPKKTARKKHIWQIETDYLQD